MTRNSSPSFATTSSVETTFGCRMRAASRASSRNIETNSGSVANCGMQALDRDGAREADGAEQPPEVHGRHAAGGDLVVERVAPDHPQRSFGLNRLLVHAGNFIRSSRPPPEGPSRQW